MVIRSRSVEDHVKDLAEVFGQMCKYGMRLNPAKCTFGVSAGIFLGFMLTAKGIVANPNKCKTGRAYQAYRKGEKSVKTSWDDRCEEAFNDVKGFLASPPVMGQLDPKNDLQLFLAVSEETIRAALVQESPEFKLVYFISKTLQDADIRYKQVEKIALVLVVAARRLRPYFKGHQVAVRIDHPIAKILRKPDLMGRIGEEPSQPWKLFIDESTDKIGRGAGVVLEGLNGLLVEQSILFRFEISNNQADYEAVIAGLELAKDLGATSVECRTYSQLVVGQLDESFQTKDDQMLWYYHKRKELVKQFQMVEVKHVPKTENTRVDILSKLASSKEKGQLSSVIRQVMLKPSIECLPIFKISNLPDWRKEIGELIKRQEEGSTIER
ncbi:uncharacterized protein LOC108336859 [Vigna angularis]|uniref:uncharacterized protein LOC108336859 n=1 Tax=Phaseolus angularis TaxID=3914 RepID=UPI00080A1558|nr:uncharacterized protein LOC108336859 [Vigna angularis]